LRNLAIAYILTVAAVIAIWVAIIPTQEKLMERLAEGKMETVVRSLQSEILSRFTTVDIEGNLTHMKYTYHNATITGWDLQPNLTTLVIYFQVNSHVRIKRFGLVVDEYDGDTYQKLMVARLEGETWRLDPYSARDVE